MRALVCLLAVAGAAQGQPRFSVDAGRAALLFTASHRKFATGGSGWVTCAGVVADVAARTAVVPLQCVGDDETLHCKSALDVSPSAQLGGADFARWSTEAATCRVLRRMPERDLAVLRVDALPKGARAPGLDAPTPPLGAEVWALGFPEQIPAFLSHGTIAVILDHVKIDGLPAGFRSPLIAVAGARSGSEGSLVFDTSGALVGLIIAHSKAMDGGFALPAAALKAAVTSSAATEK